MCKKSAWFIDAPVKLHAQFTVRIEKSCSCYDEEKKKKN